MLNIRHICDVYGSPDYDTYLPLLRNNSSVPVKYAANHVVVNMPTSLFSVAQCTVYGKSHLSLLKDQLQLAAINIYFCPVITKMLFVSCGDKVT